MSYDITDKRVEYFATDDEKAMAIAENKHETFGYTVTKTYLKDRDIYRLEYSIDEDDPVNEQLLELERQYDEADAAANYMCEYIDSPPSKQRIKDALKASGFVWLLALVTFALAALFLGLSYCLYSGIIPLEAFLENVSVSIPEGSPLKPEDLTGEFFAMIFLPFGVVFLTIFLLAASHIHRCASEVKVTYKSELERYEKNAQYYDVRINEIEDEMDKLYEMAGDIVDERDGLI